MRRGALLVVLASACTPVSQPPTAARRLPEIAWIRSEKLDLDLQEFVLRAHDQDLVFPFRVKLAAPLEQAEIDRLAARGIVFEGEGTDLVALAQPRQVEAFVDSEKVTSASCATPDVAAPTSDEWREKVDPDVRIVYAANSSCWFGVRLGFGTVVTTAVREALEQLGARIDTFDGRSSVAFVPVRAIPAIAGLEYVSAIVPSSRELQP